MLLKETQEPILCNVLCFAVNEYGKTALKLLKSSLTNFYSVEVLADAKKQLAGTRLSNPGGMLR